MEAVENADTVADGVMDVGDDGPGVCGLDDVEFEGLFF